MIRLSAPPKSAKRRKRVPGQIEAIKKEEAIAELVVILKELAIIGKKKLIKRERSDL
jgi:hypothetical protein